MKKLPRSRGLVERGGGGGGTLRKGFQIISSVFLKKSMFSLLLEFWSGKYSHLWHLGIVVINTAQLKPELRFCAGSNSACRESEIPDGEDL